MRQHRQGPKTDRFCAGLWIGSSAIGRAPNEVGKFILEKEDRPADWHQLDPTEVVWKLQSSDTGLASEEAHHRYTQYGPNELIEKGKRKAWRILLAQVKEVMILILLAAAVISAVLREYIDAIVILVIVVLNTILGFWQELKAEYCPAYS